MPVNGAKRVSTVGTAAMARDGRRVPGDGLDTVPEEVRATRVKFASRIVGESRASPA